MLPASPPERRLARADHSVGARVLAPRELDHVIERHLRQLMGEYIRYHDHDRVHDSLAKPVQDRKSTRSHWPECATGGIEQKAGSCCLVCNSAGFARPTNAWETPEQRFPRGPYMTTRILLVFAAMAGIALAQFGANLEGRISDPSGAGIPNAKVTLTDNETQRKQTTAAIGEGFYRFTGLGPGSYALAVEAPGFNRQVLDTILVSADETQGVYVTLQPGQVTQTVTVTESSTPVLNTENAQMGDSITTQEVTSLPQFGRDPYELIRIAPNVTSDMSRTGAGNSVGLPNTTGPGGSNSSIFQTENQLPVSVNGQRLSNNEYLVDGASVNSLNWGGAAVITPNQESVTEMLVLTNAYSAEWGRNSGAQIAVTSKNGTNQLHGSGFFTTTRPA
jgi:hypothetical protein